MDLLSLRKHWQQHNSLPHQPYMIARQFNDQLSACYPKVENAVARLWLWLNDFDQSTVICKRSARNRRFLNLQKGVAKFCGNQSVCVCNRENSAALRNMRDDDQKQEIQLKRAATCEQRYGVPIASQNESVKARAAATCLQRYGTISPTQNPTVLSKSKAKCLQTLGVEYPMQDPAVLQKSHRTYGVERPNQAQEFKQKYRDTMLQKYGVEHHMQHEEIAQRVRARSRLTKYEKLVSFRTGFQPLFTAEQYAAAAADVEFDWLCDSCGTQFKQRIHAGHIHCPACNPTHESWGETVIREFLDQHNVAYQQFDRTIIAPQELDFYLPDHRLAIEFNGLYWHSEKVLADRRYHFRKFRRCDEQNIKLLQIFEHELKFKSNIVLDRLAHALQLNRVSIGARRCAIEKLSNSTARDFFNSNHLQGNRPTNQVWALTYQGRMLAALSMARSRYSKKLAHWELLRYATAAGYSVPGGLTRLFQTAVNELQAQCVVSYANLSWGSGQVYAQAGFELVRYSDPAAWYFKSLDQVRSRMQFQVHQLDNPNKLTESQWAEANGWQRFWDSGNAVWLWKR